MSDETTQDGRIEELTDDDIAELRRQFDSFDADKNGQISYEEFVNLLGAIGHDHTREEAILAFSVIDSNEDDFVSFAEFVNWWCD